MVFHYFCVIHVTGIHITVVSGILYIMLMIIVFFIMTLLARLCESWSLTRMWKAHALPNNATKLV